MTLRLEDVWSAADGPKEELLTKSEAAELLKVSERMVWQWGRDGVLPRVILGTRTIRYRMEDIRTLIRKRMED